MFRDVACRLDPAMFMAAGGMPPDPWQQHMLRSTAQRSLLLCCRQAGKSTSTAYLAMHQAIYRPPALVLLLSPSLRQSGELFRKVMDVHKVHGGSAPAEAETALHLELANGSRIISLPGKEATIRGYSGVSLLVVDEAARVPDELYYSVRPMLAVSGGRLIAMTTPFGKRGFFFKEWTDGGDQFERTRVVAEQCPRIPATFLEEERRSLGDLWYRQEYGCEFLETSNQVFSYDLVSAAVSNDVQPLFGVGV